MNVHDPDITSSNKVAATHFEVSRDDLSASK